MIEYHVVETSDVTDLTLEQLLNENLRAGWTLENIQFAMREASKRPSMAFLIFTRPVSSGTDDSDDAG